MKKNFALSIPAPCSEQWDSFTPAANGGFCSVCSKVVVDFTKAGDAEVAAFFSSKPEHACGRFRTDQMKAYAHQPYPRIAPGFTLLKAGFLSLLFLLTSKPASAQTTLAKANTEIAAHPQHEQKNSPANTGIRVKGVVMAENDVAPGISVYLKGGERSTSTDEQGRFEFPGELKEGDVLVFSFIGYESEEYVVPNKITTDLQITMTMRYLTLMGAVAVVEQPEPTPSALRRFWNSVKNIF
ncbi:carboxypeptidase-like regulatory domain-containing protein [Chryseolinea lacunae]|uniref:Carboxypeptidase-like regulatory domain-containing protein n=1 Tax=Chryseolinea lacunae TaxID=2801331 RepID=A0ABS1KK76_9BACT|nr:carboxypeptidase-like regulatory domain-containing protein [Chryseolinea lacunae]MBL0739856.1 carboxypeptidase-like regulatory domain-containing protein [Chryseolinea lacunae]